MIKRLMNWGFRRIPNSIRVQSIPLIRRSKRLREIFKGQKVYGEFLIQVSSDELFKIESKGGIIENDIVWNGLFNSWESDVGWIWIELSRISDVIFDIGANVGIYSLVSKAVNPDSEVFAFEPSIHHYPSLKLNNMINNYDIQCSDSAISNFDGEQIFFDVPDSTRNTASLSPEKMKNWSGYVGEIIEYKVKTHTLKEYIDLNKIDKIDLIKIDVELHEPEVIEGLGPYLTDFKPIIIIEVLTQEVANKLNNLIDLSSFQIFHLSKNGLLRRVSNFDTDENINKSWEWNFIFFHSSLEMKLRNRTSIFNNCLEIIP